MALKVEIAVDAAQLYQDRSSSLRAGSLRIGDSLDARNTCSFVLHKHGSWSDDWPPREGQSVRVSDAAGVTLFAGTVDNVVDYEQVKGGELVAELDCVDYNQLPDRFRVAQAYDDMTAGAIVRDLAARYLAEDGVTTANVQDGPVVERVVFNYGTLTEALSDLAMLAGYAWYIDYGRDLHFFARETNSAPISIEDGGPWRKLRRRRTRGRYRNQQYIRGATATTDPRTEAFAGDGATRAFVLAFDVAEAPGVRVNGFAMTVGERGVVDNAQWYWTRGENQIVQDAGETRLTSGDRLEVSYRGVFPIIVFATDSDGKAERQSIEGGSGVYQALEVDTNLEGGGAAVDKAAALLRRYALPESVSFEVDTKEGEPTPAFRAGQLVKLNVSTLGIAGEYLIENVRTIDVQRLYVSQQIRAVSGEVLGGWIQFFRGMNSLTGKLSIRENERLTLFRGAADSVTVAESLSYTTAAPESRVGYARVGYGEVG